MKSTVTSRHVMSSSSSSPPPTPASSPVDGSCLAVISTASPYEKERKLLAHYEANLKYYSTSIQPMLKEIGKTIPSSVNSVLDVGCGDGRACIALAKELGPGVKFVGVDYSPGRLKLAKERIAKENSERKSNDQLDVTFVHGDVYSFMADAVKAEDRYDLVVCSEVLEHLVRPDIVADAITKITDWCVGSVPLQLPCTGHLKVFDSVLEVQETFPKFKMHNFGRHVIVEYIA